MCNKFQYYHDIYSSDVVKVSTIRYVSFTLSHKYSYTGIYSETRLEKKLNYYTSNRLVFWDVKARVFS